jgi:hypothetical protein
MTELLNTNRSVHVIPRCQFKHLQHEFNGEFVGITLEPGDVNISRSDAMSPKTGGEFWWLKVKLLSEVDRESCIFVACSVQRISVVLGRGWAWAVSSVPNLAAPS